MKLTKQEADAFRAAGEPRSEPVQYMDAAQRLRQTLTPEQAEQLTQLLAGFGALVRYERIWYFRRGYRAGKKETAR